MLACLTVTLCYTTFVYLAYGLPMLETPKNHAVAVGDSLTVRCRINLTTEPDLNVNGPGTIMWNRYKGFVGSAFVIGSTLYEDHLRYSVYFLEWRLSELTIDPVEYEDDALYGCNIVAVQEDFYFRLIVLKSHPVCASNSTGDVTTQGRPLLYVCNVTYIGPWAPVMQWSTSNPNITSQSYNTTTGNKTVTSSFIVEPYREDHGGKVFCKTYFEDIDPSTLVGGQATNKPAYEHVYTSVLDVYYPVRNISIHPVMNEYFPGDVITASADGNPTPQYFWTNLILVKEANIPTNYSNSTNATTIAPNNSWVSAHLDVTSEMIGGNWSYLVTAYNVISGEKSSVEVVFNFTVITVRIETTITTTSTTTQICTGFAAIPAATTTTSTTTPTTTITTTTTVATTTAPTTGTTPYTTTENETGVAPELLAKQVKSGSLVNVLAGGFAALLFLILVIAVVALCIVSRVKEGNKNKTVAEDSTDLSWFDDMHGNYLATVKTEDTPSSTYYTASGQGWSGLKLMGLMATATLAFQGNRSIEELGNQQKVDSKHSLPSKQHSISPLAVEQQPPSSEKKPPTKQHPISPLAVEQQPPSSENKPPTKQHSISPLPVEQPPTEPEPTSKKRRKKAKKKLPRANNNPDANIETDAETPVVSEPQRDTSTPQEQPSGADYVRSKSNRSRDRPRKPKKRQPDTETKPDIDSETPPVGQSNPDTTPGVDATTPTVEAMKPSPVDQPELPAEPDVQPDDRGT